MMFDLCIKLHMKHQKYINDGSIPVMPRTNVTAIALALFFTLPDILYTTNSARYNRLL